MGYHYNEDKTFREKFDNFSSYLGAGVLGMGLLIAVIQGGIKVKEYYFPESEKPLKEVRKTQDKVADTLKPVPYRMVVDTTKNNSIPISEK
jgi:hypothetical protein